MTKCYAYRGKGCCEETLEKHVVGILHCLESRWEFNGLVGKTSRLLNIDRDIIAWLIRLSAVLHDIGKASSDIQQKCREECTKFPYHFVYSARFAVSLGIKSGILQGSIESVFNNLLWSEGDRLSMNLDGLYIVVVVIPVLLHHYAGTSEKSLLRRIIESELTLEIGKPCMLSLLSIVEILRNEAPRGLKPLVDKLSDMITKGKADLSVIPGLQTFLHSYRISFAKYLAEAVIGLLNICDGIVAKQNRTARSACLE
ncbi:MAG: hypothetical protein QXF91_04835 [Desulfurococcaceae archaeon]